MLFRFCWLGYITISFKEEITSVTAKINKNDAKHSFKAEIKKASDNKDKQQRC